MSIQAIDEATKTIDERLNELRPLVAEYHTLESVKKQIAGATNTPASRPIITVGSRSKKGETANAVQRVVMDHSEGISVHDIAEMLEKHQSYVYAVVSRLCERNILERDGKLVKPRVRKAVLASR